MKLSDQIIKAASTISSAERAIEELASFDFTGLRISTTAADIPLTAAAHDRLLATILEIRESIREAAMIGARSDLTDAVRYLKEITRHLEYPQK